VAWLTSDQLSQRLAVTQLDWSAVDADRRSVALREERAQVLDRLGQVPRVLSRGDFGGGKAKL
jgi:hypothetical protein